ncbi:MAG: SprT-like domain-containing protein [Arcobacteraceae bacterium]|nr:SprT-like domain-containing protein [Arcobacteraceae bacterium]
MGKYYKIFMLITVISIVLLTYISYNNQQFKNNPLSLDIVTKIENKKNKIRALIYNKYRVDINIPIEITDKIGDNLFGLATFTKDKKIKIYLNKKRFKENEEYMIDYVLPHEYAHAIMFYFGDFTKENGGHSKRWQDICLALDGKKCDRYVNHNDILIEKVRF